MRVNDPILFSSPLPSPLVSTPHLPKSNAGLSSSPDLPSASQVLAKWKEHTVSGNGAKRAPEDAVVAFTTAASLLNSDCKSTAKRALPIGHYTAVKIDEPPLLRPRDSLTYAESGEGKVGQKQNSLKKLKVTTTSDTISQEKVNVEAEAPLNAGNSAKKRCGKRSTENGQLKINKSKVTKPGNAVNPKQISAFKTLLGNGEDFSRMLEEQDSKRREAEENLSLCLDEATRRRQSWTPIKDTPREGSCSDDKGPVPSCSLSSSDTTDALILLPNGFGDILGRFGIEKHVSKKSARPTPSRSSSGDVLTKRRKLELVSGVVTQPSLPALSKKTSSVKKRPQTITAKASAPFVSEKEPTATILNYFDSSTTGSANPPHNETASDQHLSVQSGKQQSSAKGTRIRRLPVTKTKKPIQEPPIVLSPETAMKNVHEQDLMFGTSSQLEQDESSTFMRDLRCAIKESEAGEVEKRATPPKGNTSFASSTSSSSMNIRLHATSRDLWSVAARDIKGSLLCAEVINLTESPLSRPCSTETAKIPVPDDLTSDQPAADSSSEWRSIVTPAYIDSGKPPGTKLQVPTEEPSIPKSVAEATLKERPRSRSPIKQKRSRKGSKASNSKLVPLEKPNYKGYTTNDLKLEVKSNGFKPIRRREEMIALLDRCWESRNRAVLQSLPPNIKLSTAPVENPTVIVEGLEDDSSKSKKCLPTKGVKSVRKAARAATEVVDMMAPTPPTRTKKRSRVVSLVAP